MIDRFLAWVSRSLVKLGVKVDQTQSKRKIKKIEKEEKQEADRGAIVFAGREPQPLPSINEKIIRISHLELGVKEVLGDGNSDQVEKYHLYASKENNVHHPDSVPWCSSFICYVIEKSGLRSTNSLMARSWSQWGDSSKDLPAPGDIVVFWRGKRQGPFGHVGIYLRTNADGNIVCLGGNQNDEVNISIFNSSQVLDIRRASSAIQYDKGEMVKLNFLAQSMISGNLLELAERVV